MHSRHTLHLFSMSDNVYMMEAFICKFFFYSVWVRGCDCILFVFMHDVSLSASAFNYTFLICKCCALQL